MPYILDNLAVYNLNEISACFAAIPRTETDLDLCDNNFQILTTPQLVAIFRQIPPHIAKVTVNISAISERTARELILLGKALLVLNMLRCFIGEQIVNLYKSKQNAVAPLNQSLTHNTACDAVAVAMGRSSEDINGFISRKLQAEHLVDEDDKNYTFQVNLILKLAALSLAAFLLGFLALFLPVPTAVATTCNVVGGVSLILALNGLFRVVSSQPHAKVYDKAATVADEGAANEHKDEGTFWMNLG